MSRYTAGNNSKLASSVQRDYQQAARNHRLAKQLPASASTAKLTPGLVTIGLLITTVGAFAAAIA